MRVVTLRYPVTMQQHYTWSGMDQRQHGELVTLVLKLYGCIRCPGEESSSHINLLLRWLNEGTRSESRLPDICGVIVLQE